MNSRTTLFLVVLAGLVAGFVVWDHYKGTPTAERQGKSKRILDFDPKDITRIDLVRSNQTIALEKTGDAWDMKQPLAVRADYSAVSSILDEMEFTERTRTITEKELQGVSLTDFGLESPVIRVMLHSKKRPVGLLIGHETPTKDALYVQVEGRKDVYVANKSLQERLTQSVESLRSRTAIEFTPATVNRLEIKAADRIIELSRANSTNTESRWTLTRPLVARADQGKVSELLAGLNGLRIQDFVSEDPKDLHTYLLDEPERELTVFIGEAGKTLELGKPLTNDTTKVYAKLKSGNSIFTVAADVIQKFAVQINDLRDPRVLTFPETDVKDIEILHGTDKITVTRTGSGWKVTAPTAVDADENSIRQLLGALAGLRAKQFTADVATDLDRYGLAAPATTVTLLGEGTNVLAQLLVGNFDASNDVQFVKRSDEPFIYGVESNALDRIPSHYGALRTRQLYDLNPDQITQLVAGSVTVSRDPQGKWKLVEPAQGVLDSDSVRHLLEIFCKLRADSYARAKTDADASLGMMIRVSRGEATHWLAVASDGRAAADVCELTFQLDAPTVQTLTKDLVVVPAKP